MPLLGGLFSRKNKAKRDAQASSVASSTAPEDLDSNLPSPTPSYVTPDKHIPSSPNGRSYLHHNSARDVHAMHSHISTTIEPMHPSSSSSKLRLPFGRKKSTIGGAEMNSSVEASSSLDLSPRPPYMSRLSTSSAASDASTTEYRRLRPPPSKSAIFAAYGDPHSALSTRSLPNEGYYTLSDFSSTPPPPLPTKKPSLFTWTKSSGTSSSKKVSPSPVDEKPLSQVGPSTEAGDSSFNLKSFRHIRPPSPTRSNGSNVSLTSPIARPRGESVQSESQRISVAAFREAQSRRSQAGSPSPSFRSPSPLPNVPTLAPSNEASRGRSSPRPSASTPHITQTNTKRPQKQRRKSGMSFATSAYPSDSDESETSSEEDSDNDTQRGLGKQRITPQRSGLSPLASKDRMGKARAKSELGHGSTSYTTPLKSNEYIPPQPPISKSHLGHGWSPTQPPSSSSSPAPPVASAVKKQPNGDKSEIPPRSQSSLSHYGAGLRPRASNSTSALAPSAAAKRASVVATANGTDVLTQYKRSSRHIRDSSIHSNPGAPPTSPKAATHLGHGPVSQDSSSDSDSDSEDNAPLASFLNPRRPGSAMSAYSNGYARSVGNVSAKSGASHGLSKPLIDIKELTGGSTTANKSGNAPTFGSTLKANDGFTHGHTLLSDMSLSPSPTRLVENPNFKSLSQDVISKNPPVKFISPPGSPPLEAKKVFTPPRSATMPLPTKETSPERKRDALTERLSKAVKKPAGSSPISAENSPVPASTASPSLLLTRETSPTGNLSRGRAISPSAGPASFGVERQRTTSPRSISDFSLETSMPQRQGQRSMSVTSDLPTPAPVAVVNPSNASPSPPQLDLSLADLLGAGIKLISRNGESSSESDSSDSSDESDDDYDAVSIQAQKESQKEKEPDRIAPIPIKQREPQPSFSVTSRPQFPPRPELQSAGGSGSSSGSAASGSKSPDAISPFTSTGRKRSSTLIPSPTTSSTLGGFTQSYGSSGGTSPAGNGLSPSSANNQANNDRTSALRAVGATVAMHTPRQRSTTMLPMMPVSSQSTAKPSNMPSKPFAVRRDSPASSTGDSSSGRAPLTPRDGSDIVARERRNSKVEDEYSGGASGLGIGGKGKQIKRRSVSFEDDLKDLTDHRASKMARELVVRNGGDNAPVGRRINENQREVMRKERRREEAKAAIELGNVINGRGPIVEDDDEMPINQTMNSRMSNMNSMMNMGPMPMQQMNFGGQSSALSPGSWGSMGMNMNMNLNMTMQQQAGNAGMLSPSQFMLPPPADPNFFAAHQHAMMIAKQAYQMAVAQQAMAAAADEWERSSNIGGFGGSVYGGSAGPSPMMSSPFGMMGGMNSGMGMGGMNNMSMLGGGNNWSTGSAIFPPSSSRSMYGGGGNFNSSRSEYGGGMGGGGGGQGGPGNWSSSRSSYGESFGPSNDRSAGKDSRGRTTTSRQRDSGYFPPVPPLPTSSGTPNTRNRTISQPASPTRSSGNVRKAPPPSSWKAAI